MSQEKTQKQPKSNSGSVGVETVVKWRFLKQLKSLIFHIVYILLGWGAAIEHIEWCKNVFLFWTWFTLIIVLFAVSTEEVREKCCESYRKGLHLPEWLDHVLYLGLVIVIVSQGWFFTGMAWTIKWLVDVGLRMHAMKEAT